jgi:lysophospholipase L1-like esterase
VIRTLSLIALGIPLAVSNGCSREASSLEESVATKPSPQAIAEAARTRVVFAHQSVGNNILDGVKQIAADAGVPIAIIETREPPQSTGGIFHFKVGENGAPARKLEDFAKTLNSQDFSHADVALVKLCYIDFEEQTEAGRLANQYLEILESLRGKYPNTRFLAAFDIAAIESDGAGSSVSFEFEGKQIQALDPRLTNDGGHLNETGRALVAAALIELIAEPTASSSEHSSGS